MQEAKKFESCKGSLSFFDALHEEPELSLAQQDPKAAASQDSLCQQASALRALEGLHGTEALSM